MDTARLNMVKWEKNSFVLAFDVFIVDGYFLFVRQNCALASAHFTTDGIIFQPHSINLLRFYEFIRVCACSYIHVIPRSITQFHLHDKTSRVESRENVFEWKSRTESVWQPRLTKDNSEKAWERAAPRERNLIVKLELFFLSIHMQNHFQISAGTKEISVLMCLWWYRRRFP